MKKRTLKDIELNGKRVIARVDFNVPLQEDGSISDDARIQAALPTIRYILEQNPAKLILMSHLGRPKGKADDSLRMDPVARRLSELLGEKVEKTEDCVGPEAEKKIRETGARVVVLENLRFHPEEKAGDKEFAQKLASYADVYVNDAFGTAHRAHASTTIIAQYLPSCLGFLMEKEVKFLSSALNPQKPYVVILGGAKVSDKIEVISQLMKSADTILIGGAMAYTFLKAKGESVGASRVENEKLEVAAHILQEAGQKGVKIVLPVDHLVVEKLDAPASAKTVESIPEQTMGVDVGPKTVELFEAELRNAKTVLWNGPLGIFETAEYAAGTEKIAGFLGKLKEAVVIVGGGDSASAAKQFRVAHQLNHVSTGGGASLEFLEGKTLPGIAAVAEKE
ncbi:MAG: phosphoglycerate kinase [Candidatus Omnitrophica bacterium]|nr:phosphoglycerate kinase [Candidatus Omnitrophota bacterium]